MRVSGAVKRMISTSDRGPVAAADHADDDDGDQRSRQRDHEVDPAHDDRVDQAAEIARKEPEQRRDGEGARRDHDRADQRRPRAVDDARKHVAAEQVGAGEELRRRRLVADCEALGEGRIRRDAATEDGADHDDRHDQHGDDDDARRGRNAIGACRPYRLPPSALMRPPC